MSSFSAATAVDAASFCFCCSGVSNSSGTVMSFSMMASAPELTSRTRMRAL